MNQKYNESKTQLASVGTAPILVEGVGANITLTRAPKSVKALDINGDFIKDISLSGRSFNINASDAAFFYEIVF